jgi:DNA primase
MIDKDQVKQAVNILDVVSRLGFRVHRGNFIHSIYKTEKTPSLKIWPDKNSYYCFATGQGGDVIRFYQDYYNTDFATALKELANMAGLAEIGFHISPRSHDLKPTDTNPRPDFVFLTEGEKECFEERAAILENDGQHPKETAELIAREHIKRQRKEIQSKVYKSFRNYCGGPDMEARQYLLGKSRGLTKQTLDRFGIFSIKDYSAATNYLKENFGGYELAISRLINEGGNLIFYRHRIIIPFFENGQITDLRGRYFFQGNTTPDNGTKYLGLQSSRKFFNTDILNDLKDNQTVYITEGEFDCMILCQAGYNALGILGAKNFTEDMARQVIRYDVVLCFDTDSTGAAAIKDIGQIFYSLGRTIRAKELPKNRKDITEFFTN